MSVAPGTEIADRFVLESLVGEGGHSMVWKARDRRIPDQRVAIKVFKTSAAPSSPATARHFRRELKALCALDHPSIVRVREGGEWNGCPFIVMDLLDGHRLSDWIAARRAEGASPTLAQVGELFDRLTSAIAAIHERGVSHRDITPNNVLVLTDSTGRIEVKVFDFGLSHDSHGSTSTAVTAEGTPTYAAPEQALGGDRRAGPRSDVFSLAILLIEMLTLSPLAPSGRPWVVEVSESHTNLASALTQLRSDVPAEVARAVAKAAHPDPRKRFSDATALRAALRRAWPHMRKSTPLFDARRDYRSALAVLLGVLVAAASALAVLDSSFSDFHLECIPTMAARQVDRLQGSDEPHALLRAQRPPPSSVDCEFGGPKDCTTQGARHEYGQGVGHNYALSAAYYVRACRSGDGVGCGRMGLLLSGGRGVTHNLDSAVAYLALACNLGYTRACSHLADTGALSKADALLLIEMACAADEGLGCWELAKAYWYGGAVAADHSMATRVAERALSLLITSCDSGETEACYSLAKLHRKTCRSELHHWRTCIPRAVDDQGNITRLIRPDDDRAFLLAARACEAGELRACTYLGDSYYWGLGVGRDRDRAYRLYRQSCHSGEVRGCRMAGFMHQWGEGGAARDVNEAALSWVRSCNAGDDSECLLLVDKHGRYGKIAYDPGKAALSYADRCDGMDAYACYGVVVYLRSQGSGQKHIWEQAACDRGFEPACLHVAHNYTEGQGVAADPKRALAIVEPLCKAGNEEACSALGLALARGRGTAADGARARRVLSAVCGDGDMRSCTCLGAILKHGTGVPRSEANARAYFERACDGDEALACANLATLHQIGGVGVPRDLALTKSLREKACRLGNDDACAIIKAPDPCR